MYKKEIWRHETKEEFKKSIIDLWEYSHKNLICFYRFLHKDTDALSIVDGDMEKVFKIIFDYEEVNLDPKTAVQAVKSASRSIRSLEELKKEIKKQNGNKKKKNYR